MKLNKKNSVLAFRVAFIVAIFIAILAIVLSILASLEIIKGINAFMLLFIVLSFGIGLICIVYGLIVNGGGEFGAGSILMVVGVTLLLIQCKVHAAIIIIGDLGILLIAFLALFLLKSKFLVQEKTDEKEGYVPYMEQFNAKKEQEKLEEENTPMPTIKSFKNDDNEKTNGDNN